MHGHQLHWIQLGRGGMNEVATARGGSGRGQTVLRRGGAVGHDRAPPNSPKTFSYLAPHSPRTLL